MERDELEQSNKKLGKAWRTEASWLLSSYLRRLLGTMPFVVHVLQDMEKSSWHSCCGLNDFYLAVSGSTTRNSVDDIDDMKR
jgi:hypothetical protein